MTISLELRAQILRLHQVERWPAGTIARQLHVNRDTVKRVLAATIVVVPTLRPRTLQIDAYLPFITATLTKFPRLTASRLHVMVQEHGYRGSCSTFRHRVATLRPRRNPEAFLRLRTLPGDEAQVDWA
jgi:transposase